MVGILSPREGGGRSPFDRIRNYWSDDGHAKGEQQQWGSNGGSDGDGVTGEMIWNESIAGALGYGKK
jgi:hypothetical protein